MPGYAFGDRIYLSDLFLRVGFGGLQSRCLLVLCLGLVIGPRHQVLVASGDRSPVTVIERLLRRKVTQCLVDLSNALLRVFFAGLDGQSRRVFRPGFLVRFRLQRLICLLNGGPVLVVQRLLFGHSGQCGGDLRELVLRIFLCGLQT